MPHIVEINDFNVPELDIYARLTENQLVSRRCLSDGLFIAESPVVIERALDAGCVPVSMLTERKHIEGQAKNVIARCGEIEIYTAPLEILTQLTGFALTRGVLCAMKRPELKTAEVICSNARRIAVLEDVMNPTNLGAIFRSAAALNVDAVLLTPGCTDPLYRRCVRVSMGTVFQIPWAYIGNSIKDWPAKGLERLRKLNFKTASMALRHNTVQIDDLKLNNEPRLAIILGTEGAGLREETIDMSDYTVKIPMSHGVDSLNVAAASAVAFWQLCNHYS